MGLKTPANIYFLKPGRGKSPRLLYHPGSAVEKSVANHMLFLHAMSGCDSTSALFNQGKVKFLKTLSKNPDLESYITKFTDPSAHPEEITVAGEKFLIVFYGGNHPTTTLNKLRYKQYVTSRHQQTRLPYLPLKLQLNNTPSEFSIRCSSGSETTWIQISGGGS